MFEIPKKKFSGYIFDLDGTVVDSMPVYFRAWSHAFKLNGAKFNFTWEHCISWGGKSAKDTIEEANELFNEQLDVESVRRDQQLYVDKYLHEAIANHELVEFIKTIKDYPTAIASGNRRSNVDFLLERLKLTQLFDVIVTQEDVEKCKPAPDIFLLAAKKLNTPPPECLVFEDSDAGIQAAKAAGMDYVRVEIVHSIPANLNIL